MYVFIVVSRVTIFEETKMVADSGYIINKDHLGGRLGVFVFSQENVIWSDLVYRCTGKAIAYLVRPAIST